MARPTKLPFIGDRVREDGRVLDDSLDFAVSLERGHDARRRYQSTKISKVKTFKLGALLVYTTQLLPTDRARASRAALAHSISLCFTKSLFKFDRAVWKRPLVNRNPQNGPSVREQRLRSSFPS